MSCSKIKAEIFKLSTLSKLMSPINVNEERKEKGISSKLKNDELGYFNSLENL